MTEEGIDERELLWLLRSKVRRMIIEAVGDSGRIGAVALRDKLGISTGSLYHNLRQLKHLVTPGRQEELRPHRARRASLQAPEDEGGHIDLRLCRQEESCR